MSGLESSHGQNDRTTRGKESIIALVLGYLIKVASRNIDDAPYFIFDINSGSGSNRHALSTPEIIHRQMIKWKALRFHACFVDISRTRCKQLGIRFPPQTDIFGDNRRSWDIVNMDNRLFVPQIPSILERHCVSPKRAEGIIIGDPDGSENPLPELEALSRACPKIDMIIRVGSHFKNRGYYKNNPDWPIARDCHAFVLADVTKLNKRMWLVAKQRAGRGGAFIFIGTNLLSIPGMSRLGLYRQDEPEGKRIMNHFEEGGRWQD